MKLREREEPLDPRAERELDAVDRALAGREVEADLADWEELTALLSEERPEPSPEWAERLDRRAQARFPGEGEDDSLRGLAARLSEVRPMRVLAPAGALATAAVVAVVAVSTLGGTDESSQSLEPAPGGAEALSSGPEAGSSSEAAAEDLPGLQTADGDSAALESGSREVLRQEGFRATLRNFSGEALRQQGYSLSLRNSKIAPGTDKRQIERDVSLSLSTKPDEVRDVSDEVISITRSLDGIVASSQVSEAGRNSSATLQLTIPTRNLDTAIDRLTELANVESLDESTLDITKPYVSAQDRLRDAEAKRRSLLEALENATTDAEATALELQIDDARREISRAESRFENIARRSRLSDLSVTVVGDPDAKDDRSLGDWLDDAVDVLRTVAGILLITAAIVVPLGILIAIAWFAISRLRRGRRERALDS